MLASTAIQAVGAIQQGNAQSESYNRQAQASDYNAAVDKQQAETALQVSTANQLDQRRKARQILGQQRASAAQAKVGLGGQTQDLLERSETLAELDALNIAYDGMLKSRGFSTQAELDTFQAGAMRENASSAKRSGYMGALGAVASGGMELYKMKKTPTKTTVAAGYGGSGIRPGASVGFRSSGSTGLRFG
jgi:hypothetical protein